MNRSPIKRWPWVAILCGMAIIAGGAAPVAPSAPGVQARWTLSNDRSKYRHKTPPKLPQQGSYEEVGVTIWKLRPSIKSDADSVRTLEHPHGTSAHGVELTPVRVDSDATFAPGDKVRLSVEVAHSGFLYVINREVYRDGSSGPAKLIFPTMELRHGDNRIWPKTPLEFPDWHDDPPYFNLTSHSPEYAGEELIVLVTSQELAEFKGQIGSEPLLIDGSLLARWEKLAPAVVDKQELQGGAGLTYTRAEKEAGADRSRELTHKDELPQALYQVPVKPDGPLLLKISLKTDK